jgi:hypothetical protein
MSGFDHEPVVHPSCLYGKEVLYMDISCFCLKALNGYATNTRIHVRPANY